MLSRPSLPGFGWPPSSAAEGLTFFLPGPVPDLNKLLDWRSRGYWRNGKRVGDRYWREKRYWTEQVQAAVLDAGWNRKPFTRPVNVSCEWREPNRRRDPDNFCGGGLKLILDGLVDVGVLQGDGWRWVAGFTHRWLVDRGNPGVLVNVTEVADDAGD